MADPMVNVAQYPSANSGFEQPVTMMQRLQAERRKRLMEYQQKLIKGIFTHFNHFFKSVLKEMIFYHKKFE